MREQNLQKRLKKIQQQGLSRQLRNAQTPQAPAMQIDGQTLTPFCSNDYLGLANHPALKQAMTAGVERYGVGAGSAHLINGHFASHHQLQIELANWLEVPTTLLFSTGYMANLAVLSTLAQRGDSIIADKLNHASLLDGAKLSGAKLLRFPHGDLDAARRQLKQAKGTRVLVTDAVFSMDGDCADLAGLNALAEEFDAWLVVDEAHSFGVLGEQGRGLFAKQALPIADHIIRVGTLGKAFGTAGAFIAAQKQITDILLQSARPYLFTTAQPPAVAQATRCALDIIRQQPQLQTQLFTNVTRLRNGLATLVQKHRYGSIEPSATPIQPLVIGPAEQATRLAQALHSEGFLVPAIRPPTVPAGSSRLRFTLCASHSEQQIDALLAALEKQMQQIKNS